MSMSVSTLILQWYLSRRLHFYSHWLWPYYVMRNYRVFLESQQLQNSRNCWKNFVPQWWYPNSDPSVQETLYLSNHYGPTFYTIAAPPSRQVFFLDTKKWTFDRQEAYARRVSPFARSICFSFNFFSFITYLEAFINKVLHKHLSLLSSIWLSNCFCSNLINLTKSVFSGQKSGHLIDKKRGWMQHLLFIQLFSFIT